MKRTIALVALMFALSSIVFAHGNQTHVMGKVTSISDKSITVETTSKQSVTIELSEQTKFEKSGSPATLNDLKVGDKVVIHADASGGKLVAHEVRFGTMKRKQSMQDMKGMPGMDSSPDHK